MIYRISVGDTERGNVGFCFDLECNSNKKSDIVATAIAILKLWQDTPFQQEMTDRGIQDAVLFLDGNDALNVQIVEGEFIDDSKQIFSILGKWEGDNYFFGAFEFSDTNDGVAIMAAAFDYVCDSSGAEREEGDTLLENSIGFEPILIYRGKCQMDQVFWGDTGLMEKYKTLKPPVENVSGSPSIGGKI